MVMDTFGCTPKFLTENPKAAQALANGYFDALAMIKSDPAQTARTYIKWEGSTTPEAEVVKILGNKKDIEFSLTPNRVMDFADIMSKVGLVKQKPTKWTDLFFDGIHDRKGS